MLQCKNEFKKMYQQDPECRFGCKTEEDQKHSLTTCSQVISKSTSKNVFFENMFENVTKQKEVTSVLSLIDKTRSDMIDKFLPGETRFARTRARSYIVDGAVPK